jgi:hypothetical protein
MPIFTKREMMYLRSCRRFQSEKKLDQHITNPHIATSGGRPANLRTF